MEKREVSLVYDIGLYLGLQETKVNQYPYRTAHLRHSLMRFPRNAELERLLASKAGKRADNHTVYQIILGMALNLQFSAMTEKCASVWAFTSPAPDKKLFVSAHFGEQFFCIIIIPQYN